MLKRIFCLALCMAFMLGVLVQQVTALDESDSALIAVDAVAEQLDVPATEETEVPAEEEAAPNSPYILLDDATIVDTAPILYEGTTYVALRAVSQGLRPDAIISWEGDHAAITAEGLSITVYPFAKYIVANGRCLYVPHGVQLIDGTTLVPIRVLAAAFDAQVDWDPETRNVTLTRGTGAICPAEQYYNESDLYWLSHIINAESGNQPLEGKIAVGNVVLNRVSDPIFPNTIYDVVFQKNQFSPVRNGSINLEPNEESIVAAKLCLDGAMILPNAYWFNGAGVPCWASSRKECIAIIGNHAFYG